MAQQVREVRTTMVKVKKWFQSTTALCTNTCLSASSKFKPSLIQKAMK